MILVWTKILVLAITLKIARHLVHLQALVWLIFRSNGIIEWNSGMGKRNCRLVGWRQDIWRRLCYSDKVPCPSENNQVIELSILFLVEYCVLLETAQDHDHNQSTDFALLLMNYARSFLTIKTKYSLRQAGWSLIRIPTSISCEPVCLTYYYELIAFNQLSLVISLIQISSLVKWFTEIVIESLIISSYTFEMM